MLDCTCKGLELSRGPIRWSRWEDGMVVVSIADERTLMGRLALQIPSRMTRALAGMMLDVLDGGEYDSDGGWSVEMADDYDLVWITDIDREVSVGIAVDDAREICAWLREGEA